MTYIKVKKNLTDSLFMFSDMEKSVLSQQDLQEKSKSNLTSKTNFSEEYKRTHCIKSNPEALELTIDPNVTYQSGQEAFRKHLREIGVKI